MSKYNYEYTFPMNVGNPEQYPVLQTQLISMFSNNASLFWCTGVYIADETGNLQPLVGHRYNYTLKKYMIDRPSIDNNTICNFISLDAAMNGEYNLNIPLFISNGTSGDHNPVISIISYDSKTNNTISSEINDWECLRDCITHIVIPKRFNLNDITKIGPYALAHCRKLEYIYIPKTITEICENAFFNSTISNVYYEGTETEFASITNLSELTDHVPNITSGTNLIFEKQLNFISNNPFDIINGDTITTYLDTCIDQTKTTTLD